MSNGLDIREMALLACERHVGAKRWAELPDVVRAEKVYDLTMQLKTLSETGFTVLPPPDAPA